jgi:muconolactone delta-isomerase
LEHTLSFAGYHTAPVLRRSSRIGAGRSPFLRLPFASAPAKSAPNKAVGTESQQPKRILMKYMISWWERSQGSPMEYENAQTRILEVFRQWKAPDNFKIELFVIRVGDWGGYMMLDCDDPLAVHKFCSMLPAFEFEARPVIPVEDAVRVELEVMAWRDGLTKS